MSAQSDTPRTDAEDFGPSRLHGEAVCPTAFARQLERELTTANERQLSATDAGLSYSDIRKIFADETGFDIDSQGCDLFGFAKAIEKAALRAPQADAIAALRTDLAYYQAKWEHELSTVSKLERERDALRREVDELRFSLHKVIKQRNRWDDACQQAKADADDAREEVNRITNNQRLQDSATAAILERAEAAERELSELKAWNPIGNVYCQRCYKPRKEPQ